VFIIFTGVVVTPFAALAMGMDQAIAPAGRFLDVIPALFLNVSQPGTASRTDSRLIE